MHSDDIIRYTSKPCQHTYLLMLLTPCIHSVHEENDITFRGGVMKPFVQPWRNGANPPNSSEANVFLFDVLGLEPKI